MERHRTWDNVLFSIHRIDACDLKRKCTCERAMKKQKQKQKQKKKQDMTVPFARARAKLGGSIR